MARRLIVNVAVALTAAVVTTALLWAAGELFFRMRNPPSYVSDSSLVPDSELGWTSVPELSSLPLNESGAPAVAFLGDSFTHGKLWPEEAQRQLRDQGIHVNGVNLGVSGYGTTQAWLKLQRHVAAIEPRAIVLLFFAWNDLRDNYPYPELYYGPQRTTRPYLVIADNEVSSLPVRWADTVESGLLRSEFYLRVVNRARLGMNAAIVSRWPDWPSRWHWRGRLYYEQAASWQPFYRADRAETAYVRGAYDSTIAALTRIRTLADQARAPLLVIGIDNSFTVDEDDMRTFIEPNPALDPSLPMKRMAALLDAAHVAFIDAQPELLALRRELGRDVYNGPPGGLAGHLGPEGDRLIGAIAAKWLASQGIMNR